jgi:short-subunit dehydrogenase involved in D-alanine esterification of teichoic acids
MSSSILITRCTQGLGRELALRFAKDHDKVFVGRNEKLLNKLVSIANNIILMLKKIIN